MDLYSWLTRDVHPKMMYCWSGVGGRWFNTKQKHDQTLLFDGIIVSEK